MKKFKIFVIVALTFSSLYFLFFQFQNCAKVNYQTQAGVTVTTTGTNSGEKVVEVNPEFFTDPSDLKILIVVDDSFSMSQSRTQLANAMDSLVNPLKGRNSEIRIVSTTGILNNQLDYINEDEYIGANGVITQAEAQIFIFKDQKNDYEPYENIKHHKMPLWTWQLQEKNLDPKTTSVFEAMEHGSFLNKAYATSVYLAYSFFLNIGVPSDKIRLRQHFPDEKAFYAEDAWDIELQLNTFGWTEVCGVHDRTNYDLTTHGKHSGKELKLFNENSKAETKEEKTEVPHIIEIAFGTDRPTFALLDIFYKKIDEKEGKTKFLVPWHMSPINVAVFPLMKKDGLAEYALNIYSELQQEFSARYDASGSIGKRYLREDESGTPFCITIDYDTLNKESDKYETVTIRNRDTEEQKRIKVKDLHYTIHRLIHAKMKWEEV